MHDASNNDGTVVDLASANRTIIGCYANLDRPGLATMLGPGLSCILYSGPILHDVILTKLTTASPLTVLEVKAGTFRLYDAQHVTSGPTRPPITRQGSELVVVVRNDTDREMFAGAVAEGVTLPPAPIYERFGS